MSSQSVPYFTPEEYLEYDRTHEGKHEYVDGAIVAMAGGMPDHALVASNVGYLLNAKLFGGACRIYNSDLRVCINPASSYSYPDVTVVCGPAEFVDGRKDTIANPKLVVEVLSPATRNYDLGEKARMYLRMPSLTELLLIEYDRIWIEHWHRPEGEDWKRELIEDRAATLRLPTLDIEIPAAQIYSGIDLQ